MEKKQTAVEWLIEAIESQKITIVYSDKILSVSVPIAIADQAKAMEKEQIMYAYVAGQSDCEIFTMESEMEEYYNKTYNSKQ